MDFIQRGINADKDIRVVAAITTELVREACERHELTGVEAVVLGRAITAGCLLATLTKTEDERVRIQLRGDGPLGRVLVDARGDGTVRGCLERGLDEPVDPPDRDGHLLIADYVGRTGHMVVTRDIGLEQEYQGIVEILSGEIDLDLERYLSHSEQLPSALACEVKLDAQSQILRAGGVLLQTFPGADPIKLDAIRDNLHGGAFYDLLRQERTTQELMGFALLGTEFEAMDRTALEFRCTCGHQRALSVISTLGAEELEELAHEPGDTEVRCSYCGERYELEAEELLDLAQRIRQERS